MRRKPAKGAKVTYPAFDDSKYIHGPKITASSLKGKVVFFEYWGINCPPCIASMPHLQELQDKYQSKGFTVVGSHRQGLSPRVKQFLEEKNISFPVYQGLDIPRPPARRTAPCRLDRGQWKSRCQGIPARTLRPGKKGSAQGGTAAFPFWKTWS